jgi:hypothetical protein
MTSKHNYVKIALNQIEDLYSRIPFHVLQAAWENRMQPLHAGTDRDGLPMAQWAMDALMELLQIKYKVMNFPNSTEGWQNHSTNMPLVTRSKIFCSTEYSHRYDVEAFDEIFFEFQAAGEKQDKGNCKSQTKVLKRTLEKIMVQEMFLLVDAFTETPGREMNVNTFWSILSKITTSLDIEKDNDGLGEDSTNGRSHREIALVNVNREMMQNAQGADETPEEIADASKLDQLAWFQQLEEEDAAQLEYDEDNNNEMAETQQNDIVVDHSAVDTNTGNENGMSGDVSMVATQGGHRRRAGARIVIDDNETEVMIGISKKKVKVRQAKFN